MCLGKIIKKEMSLKDRQSLDIVLWAILIVDCILGFYFLKTNQMLYTYMGAIIGIYFFYLLSKNSKIANKEIKAKKEKEKNG